MGKKYFGLYIEQIIIHCVSFYSPPWIPGGTFESYGDTGQVFIGWAVLHIAEHLVYLEPFCKHWFLFPEFQKVTSGTVSALLRTVLNCHGKAFQRACIVLLTLSILCGSFLGQIEGSMRPLYSPWLGPRPTAKTFKNYVLNEWKDRGSTLGSMYLVALISPLKGLEVTLD